MGTTAAPPASALDLQESLAAKPSAIDDDGLVTIHIIRPTVGKGRGNHKYTPEMLQENAHKFTGWKMYIDHQSPAAKKAQAGLPRSIRDMGGRIVESAWDPTVPAEGRYGQGAVVGKVRPVGVVKQLIEEDPELLEASIRAKATDVTPATENGEQVWVVEGIRDTPPGSVDWVSEGGAGGRVVADLIEALIDEADAPDPDDTPEGGDEVADLLEALRDEDSDASKAITDLVEAKVNERVDELKADHERELEEAREEGKREGTAEADRKIALTSMKEKAHDLIEAAALPEVISTRLKGDYALGSDGAPTPKLDVEDRLDDSDNVTKPAMDLLTEAVQADIDEQRELLAALNPAKVRGQGAGAEVEGGTASTAPGGYHREFLEEAGIDPEEAWDGKTPATATEEEND